MKLGWDFFWGLTLILGVGTFLLRASVISTLEKLNLPEIFFDLLKYIPASVLAALVVPAIVMHQGSVGWAFGKERLLAGLVAAAVALSVKNMLATIFAGMLVLFLLRMTG